MLNITLLLTCLLLFCWPASAQETDPQKLANVARDNGIATYANMKNYAFDLKVSLRMFDKKGRVKETLVYRSHAPLTRKEGESGYRALILIEKNGKPVPGDRVQRETIATGKRIDRLENKQASTSPKIPDPQPGYLKLGNIHFAKDLDLSPSTIMSKCVFNNPVRTSLSSRSAIQLDFTSCSTDGLDKNEMYIAKLAGRVWIDQADKVMSRLEAWIPDPKSIDPSANPQFIYEQTKVDSHWFPRMAIIDGSSSLLVNLLLSVEKIEYKIEFWDYKSYSQ